jgi:hypothetical protein
MDGGVRELLLLGDGGERLAASLRDGRGNPGTVELDRSVRELCGRRHPSAMDGGNNFLRDWQGADLLDSRPRLGPAAFSAASVPMLSRANQALGGFGAPGDGLGPVISNGESDRGGVERRLIAYRRGGRTRRHHQWIGRHRTR